MKIASKIKPKSGKPRTVTIHGRPYVFAPVLDKNDVTHFVAEVKDEDHAAVLLGTSDFYPFGDALAPQPTLKSGQAPAAPRVTPAEPVDPAVQVEANALLGLSLAKISVEVGKVSSLAVVHTALATEQAAETPRKTVLALLQTTLDGATAAGVKG
jgi:hypothetical protein